MNMKSGSRGNRVCMALKAITSNVCIPLALLLTGCASSLGEHGYELDVEACETSGGMVLINHNTETSRCLYQ